MKAFAFVARAVTDEEGPHVRDTSVVVGQLLSEARQSLWISTYSIFNGQEVFYPFKKPGRSVPTSKSFLAGGAVHDSARIGL